MRLLHLIMLAALIGLSHQGSWQDLVHLSEEEARAFLEGEYWQSVQEANGAAGLPPHIAPGHPAHPDNFHWQSIAASSSGSSTDVSLAPVPSEAHKPRQDYLGDARTFYVVESGDRGPTGSSRFADTERWAGSQAALEPSSRRPRKQQLSPGSNEAAHPPARDAPSVPSTASLIAAPLTIPQREHILRQAVARLPPASQADTILQPLTDFKLPERLLQEFSRSQTFFREFAPGFLFQARGRALPPWRGEGGMVLEGNSRKQLFVYRYERLPASPEARTRFQFVGMLQLAHEANAETQAFGVFRSTRSMISDVRDDSFVNENDLVSSSRGVVRQS
ncbi:hypothetical protein EX895_003369 [Sporisorium graminicola]|uniref:Uncharacterized protein n=1 Tax=Sporisorium graminicola TaxID=280036 RepID=A0A4U7KWE6_9BASI|nr:hypothetical protein EX895_003369 [Sporisorium graminicola]TKY87788.1 hypothetical protein EX895_003369 [Sporisorium graminicola]